MKIIGYNYALIHIAAHLLAAGLLYFAVQPDLSINLAKFALIALGTAVVDLDHIFLWKDLGLKGYLKLRSIEEFGKPRKYKFHNLMVIFGAFGGSLLILVYEYFFIGLFFVAMSLHLLWDFFEDIIVFKMGYRHWI